MCAEGSECLELQIGVASAPEDGNKAGILPVQMVGQCMKGAHRLEAAQRQRSFPEYDGMVGSRRPSVVYRCYIILNCFHHLATD